jgi:class IV lanthipeptide synthase
MDMRSERARELSRWYRTFLGQVGAGLPPEWQVSEQRTADFVWRSFVPTQHPSPAQGWKIHVSAAAVEARRLCEVIVPLLIRHNSRFKLPASAEGITQLNSGLAGDIQVGKVITVYPGSASEARALAEELDRAWPSSAGPAVLSDIPFRTGGAVFFRYGVFQPSDVVIDAAGHHAYALRNPQGELSADERRRDGMQPPWVHELPVDACPLPGAEDGLNPIATTEGFYLPVLLLRNSVRGTVVLALNLNTGKSVIVKTARMGACGDLRGIDGRDRLRNEFAVLKKIAEREKFAPQPLSICENPATLLVMEDLAGVSLDKTEPQLLQDLVLLALAVAQLHEMGIIHRDIKLSNAVKTADGVRLIDFELACAIGEYPAIPECGTRAYIPPEGSDIPARPASDVFALGVSLASFLLRYDAALLPSKTRRTVGLLHLFGLHSFASLVSSMLALDFPRRPSAARVASMLDSCSESDAVPRPVRTRQRKNLAGRNWLLRSASETAQATRRFAVVEGEEQWWRNCGPESSFACEGISPGASGIILGLATVDEALGRSSFQHDIARGAQWLSRRKPGECNSFFGGNAGVALALTVAALRTDNSQWLEGGRSRLLAAVSGPPCDFDLLSGRAGILWAGCIMAELLRESWPLDLVSGKARELQQNCRRIDGVLGWDKSGDPNLYTGAAHGTSGIAMALALWGRQTGCETSLSMAMDAFQSLRMRSQANARGEVEFLSSLGVEAVRSQKSHWCHGMAGYLWCVLQSFGDIPELAREVDWAVEGLRRCSLDSPTLCHGLAGLLELWRMLRSVARWSAWAGQQAELAAGALRLSSQRQNGFTVWCSDEPKTITPDLWLGFLGPACNIAMHSAGITQPLLSASWLKLCSSADDRVPAPSG